MPADLREAKNACDQLSHLLNVAHSLGYVSGKDHAIILDRLEILLSLSRYSDTEAARIPLTRPPRTNQNIARRAKSNLLECSLNGPPH